MEEAIKELNYCQEEYQLAKVRYLLKNYELSLMQIEIKKTSLEKQKNDVTLGLYEHSIEELKKRLDSTKRENENLREQLRIADINVNSNEMTEEEIEISSIELLTAAKAELEKELKETQEQIMRQKENMDEKINCLAK